GGYMQQAPGGYMQQAAYAAAARIPVASFGQPQPPAHGGFDAQAMHGHHHQQAEDQATQRLARLENALLSLKPQIEVVSQGLGSRKVRATAMNADSSRSHFLLIITMEMTDKETGRSRTGKISIVDLAGSERLGKSGVSGEGQKEAIEINKSLTALGDVMMAFTQKAKVIPYRNSKLTQLMQDSLGGTAKTLMFVNISPSSSNVDESISSLKYASRARRLSTNAELEGAIFQLLLSHWSKQMDVSNMMEWTLGPCFDTPEACKACSDGASAAKPDVTYFSFAFRVLARWGFVLDRIVSEFIVVPTGIEELARSGTCLLLKGGGLSSHSRGFPRLSGPPDFAPVESPSWAELRRVRSLRPQLQLTAPLGILLLAAAGEKLRSLRRRRHARRASCSQWRSFGQQRVAGLTQRRFFENFGVLEAQVVAPLSSLEDFQTELRQLVASGDRDVQLISALVDSCIAGIAAARDQKDSGDGDGGEAYLVAALQQLLAAGFLRQAVRVFDRFARQIPLRSEELHGQILRILGSSIQVDAAVEHVRYLLQEQEIDVSGATRLFNRILSGIVEGSTDPNVVQMTEIVINAMDAAGASRSSETLRLMVEAKVNCASQGFLTEAGQDVLDFARRSGPPDGCALLAVSAAHLRGGDLDAAYRWFVASQLSKQRQVLNDRPSGEGGEAAAKRAMELVSQLARALAIGGQAQRLLRLLQQVSDDEGSLPPCASSVSLAGYTCGRTLATCWLEPPAEVVRRRAIWSGSESQTGLRVSCAEQFDWNQLETSRHEVYQWSPYLSPDTKPERAWQAPLRLKDPGSLGLARDWMGEGPTAAAARERLGERPWRRSGPAVLDRALKLQQPQLSTGTSSSSSAAISLVPQPRTWRVHHADIVKRAFLTPARISPPSPAHLRKMMLAERATRLMVPGSKEASVPLVRWSAMSVPALVRDAPKEVRAKLQTKSFQDSKQVKEMTKGDLIRILEDLQVDVSLLTKPSMGKLEEMVIFAASLAVGEQKVDLLNDLEYLESIRNLSDEKLHELWEAGFSSANTEVFGKDISELVEAQMMSECEADEEVAGDAADVQALCGAAHAADNKDLAAQVLRQLKDDILKPEVSEEANLGTAGQSLADAMTRGGWQRSSAEEFLLGQRLLPERDANSPTGLGNLTTRYLDPLMGLEGSDADRRGIVQAWVKPHEVNVSNVTGERMSHGTRLRSLLWNALYFLEETLRTQCLQGVSFMIVLSECRSASYVHSITFIELQDQEQKTIRTTFPKANEAQSIYVKRAAAEKHQITVSARRVLEALLTHPAQAKALKLRGTFYKVMENTEVIRRLRDLELPVPQLAAAASQLLKFVVELQEELSSSASP
ncbi:unnamed protein product, partial [Polarella glacialis]